MKTGSHQNQSLYVAETDAVTPHVRWGVRATGAVVLLAVAWLCWGLATNPAFEWPIFATYLFHRDVLAGLGLSLMLTLIVSILGFAFGTVLAVMRLSGNLVLSSVSAGYVWVFRSVPVLVQLLLWYNIGYLIPEFRLGLPSGSTLFSMSTQELIPAIAAAILGLTFSEAAHAAEIVRGGLLSVSRGTVEAGHALGLTPRQILRRIILPQAIPTIVPAAGNLIIGTLKGTSIVSIIAVADLLYSVQLIYNDNYKIMPLLMVATAWYLVMTTLLTFAQGALERRFASDKRVARATLAGAGLVGQT